MGTTETTKSAVCFTNSLKNLPSGTASSPSEHQSQLTSTSLKQGRGQIPQGGCRESLRHIQGQRPTQAAGDQPCCRNTPQQPAQSPKDQWPRLAPETLWHSLQKLRQGWTSWARWDRRCCPCSSTAHVTSSRGCQLLVTCHLHPPATAPRTWQEETWSELGSRRGQCGGLCHRYHSTAWHSSGASGRNNLWTSCKKDFPC